MWIRNQLLNIPNHKNEKALYSFLELLPWFFLTLLCLTSTKEALWVSRRGTEEGSRSSTRVSAVRCLSWVPQSLISGALISNLGSIFYLCLTKVIWEYTESIDPKESVPVETAIKLHCCHLGNEHEWGSPFPIPTMTSPNCSPGFSALWHCGAERLQKYSTT